MSATQRIALFPLRTVLFPQGLLPLRIFETRYLDMIRRVMREDAGFGVVLIRTGGDVGEIGELAQIGTWARVADFGQLPDGLLKIVARGERRFRVVAREIQADGLHLAEVSWIEDPPERLQAGEFEDLAAMLTNALEDLDEDYPVGERRTEDALWLSGHLGQLLPVPAETRQKILETDGAYQRLQLIAQLRTNT